jgi:hypothetical protein
MIFKRYMLFGDRSQWETQTAINILDEAGLKYRFVQVEDSEFELLPQLNDIFTDYIGLEEIAWFASMYKPRNSLAGKST